MLDWISLFPQLPLVARCLPTSAVLEQVTAPLLPRPRYALSSPLQPDSTHRGVTLLFLGWLFFCVYGSLVPLAFQFVPPDIAWQRFTQAPMLQLGAGSRADWIANGLLYVPLGLLGTLVIAGSGRRPGLTAALASALLAMVVALVVEYLQVYFPPRTVSRNDLIAEAIGAGSGALLAWQGASAGRHWAQRLRASGAQRWAALGSLYLISLLLLALFPFDLLISEPEWAAKLKSGNLGLLLATGDDERPAAVIAGKIAVELLAMVPVGLWLAHRQVGCSVPRALAFGAAAGLVIELIQLSLASGVSQGISVVTRALGTALGAWMLPHLQRRTLAAWQSALRPMLPVLVVAHLPLLALAYGWSGLPEASLADAQARWDALHWLPLHYHYFTTETVAVRSVLVALLAYAPFGVYAWARQTRPGTAAMWAALAAACIESGRLVLPGTRPDPSNLWIAAAAAYLVHRLLLAMQQPAGNPGMTVQSRPSRRVDEAAGLQVRPDDAPVPMWRWLLLAGVLGAGAWHLLHFPVLALALGVAVVAATALVIWRPILLFMIVPAALPVLDLAPFTGRRFIDELDLLIGACAAAAWVRLQRGKARPPAGGWVAWSLMAMLLMLVVGVMRALWPWPGLPIDAFDQPMGAFNALRVAKGGLWAGLLWWLGRRLQLRGDDVGRAFSWGMCAGLAATVAFVLAERMAFTSLLNFSSDYRISGPFSDMSLGGAYVECFVACALPFVLQRVLPPAPWRQALPLMLLVAGASYTLMVTYSRGGQAAGAAAVLLFVAMQVLGRHARWQRLALGLMTLAIAAVAAMPVLQGKFAQQRMSTLGADMATRERHWAESLALMGHDTLDRWLGMGLGRYAELRLWQSPPDKRVATHGLVETPEGGRALRLSTGYAYFVDQVLAPRPGERLQLQLRVRAVAHGADPLKNPVTGKPPGIQASVCQKWIIASVECGQGRASFRPATDGWWTLASAIEAPSAGGGRLPMPLRLSLHNAGKVAIEVTDVSLRSSSGLELLANGDFSAGFDRWTFTSDDHLAWHAKSMLVGTYVELGWLGVAALLALLLSGAVKAATMASRGWTEAAPMLAAITAFAIIGLIDTLVDVPRFLLLFLLLCTLPALAPPQHSQTR